MTLFKIFIPSLLSLILFLNYKKLGEIINIYDHPDNKLKLHDRKIPILGGIICLTGLILFFLIFGINAQNIPILFFLILLTFFGLWDDAYNINPYFKFFISLSIIFIYLSLDTSVLIHDLTFFYKNYNLNFGKLSIVFTILCIMLLTHSLNMIDGINGFSASYLLSVFSALLYIILKNSDNLETNNAELNFILFLIINLILFLTIYLYFNIKNLVFFGDSGIFLLGGTLSYILIKLNFIINNFWPELIFLILLFPGIDMLRLFLQRILKRKNPFKGDRCHLHHYLIKKFNPRQIIFFTLFVNTLVIIMAYNFQAWLLHILFSYMTFYFILILISQKIK